MITNNNSQSSSQTFFTPFEHAEKTEKPQPTEVVENPIGTKKPEKELSSGQQQEKEINLYQQNVTQGKLLNELKQKEQASTEKSSQDDKIESGTKRQTMIPRSLVFKLHR